MLRHRWRSKHNDRSITCTSNSTIQKPKFLEKLWNVYFSIFSSPFIPLKNVFFPPFFCEFHKRATTGSVTSFRRRAVFVPRSRRAVDRRRSYRERDTSRANCSISPSKTGRFLSRYHDHEVRNKRYQVRNTVKNEYIIFHIANLSRIESNIIIIFARFRISKEISEWIWKSVILIRNLHWTTRKIYRSVFFFHEDNVRIYSYLIYTKNQIMTKPLSLEVNSSFAYLTSFAN